MTAEVNIRDGNIPEFPTSPHQEESRLALPTDSQVIELRNNSVNLWNLTRSEAHNKKGKVFYFSQEDVYRIFSQNGIIVPDEYRLDGPSSKSDYPSETKRIEFRINGNRKNSITKGRFRPWHGIKEKTRTIISTELQIKLASSAPDKYLKQTLILTYEVGGNDDEGILNFTQIKGSSDEEQSTPLSLETIRYFQAFLKEAQARLSISQTLSTQSSTR